MSESAVRELEAGRELDALVAEKIFGWKWFRFQRMAHACCAKPKPTGEPTRFVAASRPFDWYNDISEATGEEALDESYMGQVPHYSTDIKAAWEVVEKITAEWHYEIRIEHSGCSSELWDCLIFSDGVNGLTGLISREAGDTAPLAICLAALKASDAARTAKEQA